MSAALEIKSVGYDAGQSTLLEDVSLEVARGTLVGIIGPNGAGKSSLLSIVAGDRAPTRGRVNLNGRPVGAYRPAELAQERAVLPQQTLVPFPFTTRDIVLMGRHPYHTDPENSRARDEAIAVEMMRETDTEHLEHRIFPSLSAGEKTRVALARVFAQQTPLILLDEPTATLDIHHQEHTMGLLRRRAAAGTAVLAVLHDLNLAAAYADEIVLLAAGRVVSAGPPREVLRQDLLTEAYDQPLRVVPHPHRDCPLVVVE